MRETLEMLTKLQEIDQEVDRLDHSKIDLPGEIEALKKQVQDLQKSVADGEKELAELDKQKREEELALKEAQDKLKKYQEQLYRITTNREYDAIQAEIDVQRTRISDHEENILNNMTASEDLMESLLERREELEKQEAKNVPAWGKLEQDLSSIETKMAIEQDRRKNVVVRLDKRVLNSYERIRAGKNGRAIVPIRKRACGGCYKTLPPQKIQEIRRAERIIICENCGRILYWDENSAT